MKSHSFFNFFGSFSPSWIWILIPNTDPDPVTWLAGSKTLILFPSQQRVSAYPGRRRCEGRQSRSAALPSPLAGWRRRICGTGSCGTPPGPCLPHNQGSVADPWHFGVDPDPLIYACLRLMDPDLVPDSSIFVINLQDENKKLIFKKVYFLKEHLHHFSKIKSKRSHKTVGIKVFLNIFAWW